MRKLVFLGMLLWISHGFAQVSIKPEPRLTEWRDSSSQPKTMHKSPPSQLFSGPLQGRIVNTFARQSLLSQGRAVLVIHERVRIDLAEELDRYARDLANSGYDVLIFAYQGGSAESLRSFLLTLYRQPESLEGAVFIGEIPYILFEILQPEYTTPQYEDFPCDLFFMDLDGEWLDAGIDEMLLPDNGKYDLRSGNLELELWISRIAAHNLPSLGSEIEVLRTFFNKNRDCRSGVYKPERRALIYNDDDWANLTAEDQSNACALYTSNAVHAFNEPNLTTSRHYKSVLADSSFEYLHVRSHGTSSSHFFYERDKTTFERIHAFDYLRNDPTPLFYSLYICAAADYTTNNYLAGTLLFNPDRPGQVAWSSSKIGGMWNDQSFYSSLEQGASFGAAFLIWLNHVLANPSDRDAAWWYGMVLLGDGFLTAHPYEPFQAIDLSSPVEESPKIHYWQLEKWTSLQDEQLLLVQESQDRSVTLATLPLTAADRWQHQYLNHDGQFNLTDQSVVTSADMDRNGWLDLLVAQPDHGSMVLKLWLLNGDGFVAGGVWPLAFMPSVLSTTDINMDGLPDLVLAGQNQLQIWLAKSDGKSDKALEWQPFYADESATNWTAASTFDGDRDRDLDVFAVGRLADQRWIVRFAENRQSGLSPTVQDIPLPDGSYRQIHQLDTNADGLPDIAVAGLSPAGQAQLVMLRNPGTLTPAEWQIHAVLTGEGTLSQILSGDMDQNGSVDLVVVTGLPDNRTRIQVWLSGAAGQYFKDSAIEMAAEGRLAQLDSDDDGNIDLFFLSNCGKTCRLLVNQSPFENQSPRPPTILEAAVQGDTAIFVWQPGTDQETPAAALRYQLSIGTSVGGDEILSPLNQPQGQMIGSASRWAISGLEAGRYFWRIASIDAGGKTSAPSREMTFTVQGVPLILTCKIMLEGFYDPLQQRLRADRSDRKLLPAVSPYHHYVFAESNRQGICDWVHLELRDTPDGETVAEYDALLRSDGMVVDSNNLTDRLNFAAKPGSYYLVVNHHNHLSAVSNYPLTWNGGEMVSYNFSDRADRYYQSDNCTPVSPNLWASKCGDIDRDGMIGLADFSLWLQAMGQTDYTFDPADLNGDGLITTHDYLLLYNRLPQ